ncbi:MAG: argininosuccinate lyase [Bacteroidetes bacterium]|nr:MAG: argininosuccinate lyase [Bacteroidota bacterium]
MSNPKNKLWQKAYQLDAQIEAFTVGQDRELDLLLAPFDILGSLAHGKMLSEVGLLDPAEYEQLAVVLKQLYQTAVDGTFVIADGVEDVHSQVELLLTEQLGDVGKKIHSGRSRNDQVLVDLRLYFRTEVAALVRSIGELSALLLEKSNQYQDVLLPGYTHLQVAMVSSFGLWFGAYAESLVDDLHLWQATHRIIDQNPLGSAAGYGSSFPLNRQRTTDLLGFRELAYNVVHAQMGRGKTELNLSFALAGTAQTIGKLAMDVCLYNSQNFGFLKLPNELTTGSSIMPHKKNPDVFELLRGRSNQLLSLPAQVSQLVGNLPSGYHRDFQLLKEIILPAIQQMKDVLAIATYAIANLAVKDNLLDDEKYRLLYSVEAVNAAVLEGLPFRDAYRKIAADIEASTFDPPTRLNHTHEGSLGNLSNDKIKEKLDTVLAGFGFTHWEERLAELRKV